ncbi:dicarboxylate/amino acid:cation symporter [Biformimicrobium ophioploci]|uniref:Dicarboxylate/amino acid:cation symporter n=1 Tax=Biformimicrobium ophioploci TaxID=3036711 RepID=A0ABQ6LVL4_9GAMM|nr:dicarboxylate/amino acid:cation symporter [Microbulbifer sp. NKW57]GMG86101.1 dicarboxylate/amino acid:cation symporter [Microbulbifer sp. NKW57]
MGLTKKILLAMVLGIVTGMLLNGVVNEGTLWLGKAAADLFNTYLVDGLFDVVGKIFVASLKLMVVPLVLVSLVCGACSLSEGSRMGVLAGKTIGLYLLTTGIAIALALTLAILVAPGSGMETVAAGTFEGKEAPPLKQVIVDIVPTNPFKAMVEGNMLQVIVFALLMGFAIPRCGEAGKRIAAFFYDMDAVVMKMVGFLIELAPYGVFALLAKIFATLPFDTFLNLMAYMATLAGALLLHGLGVYSALLKLFSGLNPLQLLKKMRPAQMFAFSTASSGATIPVTLATVERRLGVDNSVASFTVPLGATINMDGTAIMQGVATAFIAQAYGIDIGLQGYLMVVLTATLASIGTAAVPGVGLIMLTMVLQQVGLPVEGIALIIGVDRILDMLRTSVNITGDAVVSCIVAKSEGRLEEAVFNDTNYDAPTS